MNFESDDECTCDYGAFGWSNCTTCSNVRTYGELTEEEIDRIHRLQKQKEQECITSSNFNRHMIDLYNKRS